MIGPSLPPKAAVMGSASTPGQRRLGAPKNVTRYYQGFAYCVEPNRT
jgi:hypothetical protein